MKNLSLRERANAFADRILKLGFRESAAYRGYLAGHRAAMRASGRSLKALRAQIRVLTEQQTRLLAVITCEKERSDRFESALRGRARRDMMETRISTAPDGLERHPYKELRR